MTDSLNGEDLGEHPSSEEVAAYLSDALSAADQRDAGSAPRRMPAVPARGHLRASAHSKSPLANGAAMDCSRYGRRGSGSSPSLATSLQPRGDHRQQGGGGCCGFRDYAEGFGSCPLVAVTRLAAVAWCSCGRKPEMHLSTGSRSLTRAVAQSGRKMAPIRRSRCRRICLSPKARITSGSSTPSAPTELRSRRARTGSRRHLEDAVWHSHRRNGMCKLACSKNGDRRRSPRKSTRR